MTPAAQLEQWLSRRRTGWTLLVLVALVYLMAYCCHDLFPGGAAPESRTGWWSWSDQFEYYRTAAALAQGRLSPEDCRYPPGYAALGAVFWRLWPGHLFLLPNLALVVGAAWAWWRIVTGWLTRVQALVTGVVFAGSHWLLLADAVVIPWNTLVSQCLLLTGIALVLQRTDRRVLLGLAGLAGCTYLTRPIDAAAFAPLLAVAVLRLPGWRARLQGALAGGAVVGAAVLLLGWFNRSVFGTWRSPYEVEAWRHVGFFSYPVGWKFLWLFVDGRPFFGEKAPALLFRYPWLYLAIPGAVFWVRRAGWAALAAVAAVALNWFLYLNYNDLLPSDIYRFTLIHYLVWAFPLLAALGVGACLHGWRDPWTRAGFAVGAAALLLCFGLRLEEEPLPAPMADGPGWKMPAVRPLGVQIPGLPPEAAGQLRLEGKALTEYADYLTPFESADLRVMLGPRTGGQVLCLDTGPASAGVPRLTTFVWGWRLGPSRLRWFFR
jgi:hypothetical protein